MSTYGAAGLNRFSIPNVTGFFSVEVNAQTGVTQVYKQGAFTTEQSIGTYNPSTGTFTAQSNTSLTQQELTRIQSPEGLTAIKTAAINTATKAGATNATQLISINTAPDTGSSNPDAVNLGNIDTTNFTLIPKEKAKKHGNYQYPLEMPNDMDRITFTMIEYRGRGLNNSKLGFVERFSEKDASDKTIPKNLLGTVTMGIQPRISDRNSVAWNDTDANTLGLLAGGTSLELIQKGFSGITEILNKIGNTFEAEKGNIGTALKLKLAGEAASISGLTSRIGGAIFNPNLELLFDNPQLRPFDFTFQLTPRDAHEAKAVKQIIRFFKQGMAVQRTAADLFLKAPNVFDINYMFGQKEDHPGLNKIKTCALQSFNVDYTPTGSYMTFSDGTMTAYSITLSFKELEPVYSDQYQDPEKDNDQEIEIGF